VIRQLTDSYRVGLSSLETLGEHTPSVCLDQLIVTDLPPVLAL